MSMCDIGSDGKTPLQRLHGGRNNTPIVEFEEKILYKPAKPARGRRWEPKYHPGVFVGMLAIKTRSANIRRIPESESGTRTRYLEYELFHGPQMLVTMQLTFRSEWRDLQR